MRMLQHSKTTASAPSLIKILSFWLTLGKSVKITLNLFFFCICVNFIMETTWKYAIFYNIKVYDVRTPKQAHLNVCNNIKD